MEDRLERMESAIHKITEHMAFMVPWLDTQFSTIGAHFARIETQFQQVDRRFQEIDRRFEQVDQRFEQVDRRFEQVDEQFADLRLYIDLKHEDIRSDFRVFREALAHTNRRVDALENR